MFTRFCEITNNLKSLGKNFCSSDLVKKVLKSLTPAWKKKVTAIEEAKDLLTYSLENLIRNLTSYKVQMIEKEIEKVLEKKSIALNASIELDDSDEEDLALITHKFKIFLKKERIQKKDEKNQEKEDSSSYMG